MPELIVPTARLHEAWLASHREWAGAREEGAGLTDLDEVISPGGFTRWVDRLLSAEREAEPGWVRTTYRWIVENDRMLGAIALRHELNDFLITLGGHIGYGVRPSERRRGLATFALHQTLASARDSGLDRVLITCTLDNTASARTIERAGGLLEDIRATDWGPVKRYWIKL
jgi:predicted acetyltransferase